MVLLAASICTKAGKPLVSRQFVEMTRSRIEGLLASFPKLIGGSSKQHTFVETDTVRYVYQPFDKLYMVLLTTKASNILEDLETLRLFSRVIPEYCKTVDEKEVFEHAFDLLAAFDEIVALGYKESVNLAQIRIYTEMESHDERVYDAMRQSQERDAKNKMIEHAKKLDREKSQKPGGISSGGISSNTYNNSTHEGKIDVTLTPITFSSNPSNVIHPSTRKAMKLGSKGKNVESFVDQLKSEGEVIGSASQTQTKTKQQSQALPTIPQNEVHLKQEEKLNVRCGRDGGVENLEILGMVMLRVKSEEYGRIFIAVQNNETRNIQLQTHPNIDKKLFISDSLIGLKNPEKPFPINQDIGILKWRYQSTDGKEIPLTINCWPSETSNGGCDVNIEYELQNTNLILRDVIISIPLPSGGQTPVIGRIDGDYSFDSRKTCLSWSLPVIDQSNSEGTLEFSVRGKTADFFPVKVEFVSETSFFNIKIADVKFVDSREFVPYSSETSLVAEKYEYV
ncbi:unnamed protein product [Didymodactylos carnosus]|uniref:Coatomer subunit delta n=1 Tax=Didymodactylos carnosus TaxID=1234261 RepID=A0A814F396_9BILA|nr:unnamed protein product [Didymodactylos carnosus]CAF0977484.1 unnamed protein product [Didymodactylos carnosus]CAF3635918.1 unnamed protein product [Didymodactylos carnosus]CAF3750326.1 unnamed protein product [Didymodactylos carnosus]